MNENILIGLVLQTICLVFFWLKFRGRMFQYTGALFFLVLCTYHGLVPETLNALFPGRNAYRGLVSESSIGNVVLLFSAGMCLFAALYLAGVKAVDRAFHFSPGAVANTTAVLKKNLPFLLGSTVLCYAISFYFSLSSAFEDVSVSSEYWIYGLAVYFLAQLMQITVLALIVSFQKLSVETVILLQMLINVTALRRSAILFSILITMILLSAYRYTFDKRRLSVLFSVAAFLLLLVSLSRGVVGREALSGMSPWERFESVARSAQTEKSGTGDQVLDDFVYRFDGNASNALILESLNSGYEPLGIAPMLIDLYLQVPRAFNPAKLDTELLARDSEGFMFSSYGHDPTIDYTQGWLGYLLACFGKTGFLFAMAVLGLAFAGLDRWFTSTESVLTVPLYYIVIYNIIYYEGVLALLLGTTRTILAILLAMLAFAYVFKWLAPRQDVVASNS